MASLLTTSFRQCLLLRNLTWCQNVYLRQKTKSFTEVARHCSSYDRVDGFQVDSENIDENQMNNKNEIGNKIKQKMDTNFKQTSNGSSYIGQSSSRTSNRQLKVDDDIEGVPFKFRKQPEKRYQKKLFKERVLSDEDKAAELEDIDILNDLVGSDRFGTGVGKFVEKTGEGEKTQADNKHSGNKKKNVLPRNWSETFGTLQGKDESLIQEKSSWIENEKYWDEMAALDKETAKIHNHIRLARYNRRNVPNYYSRKMMKLGQQGKIREAIEVFDEWMIQQDRVKPTSFEFGILIKLLAEVGYTQKAFQLYNMMLSLKIYCPDVVYSSLFNACANSPWREDGLRRADQLHRKMLLKGVAPNYITYLAMIKAYGKNGELNKAFKLADEAIELHCDHELLANLLVACISDKEAGFRHAIVVWRKLKKHGIKPNLTCYNLLLKAVKDCGIGDPKLVDKLLVGQSNIDAQLITGKRNKALKSTDKTDVDIVFTNSDGVTKETKHSEQDQITVGPKPIKARKREKTFEEIDNLLEKYDIIGEDSNEIDMEAFSDEGKAVLAEESKDLEIRKEWWELDVFGNSVTDINPSEIDSLGNCHMDFPNILDPTESFSSLIHMEAIKSKEDRLALLGGAYGFLKTLQEDDIKPSIATYTQLAQVVPKYQQSMLIDDMYTNKVDPDIDFYNILIRSRAKTDKESAWMFFKQLRYEQLVPNLKTFSCLALACKEEEDGLKLIDDMMDMGIFPNHYTLNSLIVASGLNFDYKIQILRKMQEFGIKPDKYTIDKIEEQIGTSKQILLKIERKSRLSEKDQHDKDKYQKRLNYFMHYYEKWGKFNMLETEPHPWKPFMALKQPEQNNS